MAKYYPIQAIVGTQREIPDIGRYVEPAEQTLLAHMLLVTDRRLNIGFLSGESPDQLNPLQTALADHCKNKAISNPDHPDYNQYANVRANIAALTNYLTQAMTQGLDMSNHSVKDAVDDKLHNMGERLADSLNNNNLIGRFGLTMRNASIPSFGAVEMYKDLERAQRKGITYYLKKLVGRGSSKWNLPPRKQTPFNDANFKLFKQYGYDRITIDKLYDVAQSMPAPVIEYGYAPAAAPVIEQPYPVMQPSQPEMTQALMDFSDTMRNHTRSMDEIHAMAQSEKDKAIAIAREILRRLRSTEANTTSDQWVNRPSDEALALNGDMAFVVQTYHDLLAEATKADQNMAKDAVLIQSSLAVGKLTYLAQEQALQALKASNALDQVVAVEQTIAEMPAAWKSVEGDTVGKLAEDVDAGILRVIELTQAMQMNQAQLAALASLPNVPPEVLQALNGGRTNLSPEEISAMLREDPRKMRDIVKRAEREEVLPADSYQETVTNNQQHPSLAGRR